MKQVVTAICSFGLSGRVFHAPFIDLHPGFLLRGVWERSKNLASEKYSGITTYRSLDEILADDAVDLVIINTPNITHFDYTKATLLAGKHVIVEKPFTKTTSEARELVQIANEKNLFLSVFQNRRYDSDFRTVKKILEQQVLGDLIEAEIHFDRYKPELSVKHHKEVPEVGTGLLYDLGPHIIDQALVLFGMPHSLFADVRQLRPGSQIDDYFDITLFYPKWRVKVKSSLLVREPLPAYILHGTKGSFLKSRADVQEPSLDSGGHPADPHYGYEPPHEAGVLHIMTEDGSKKTTIPTERGNYLDYFNDVYEAIVHHHSIPVSGEEGIRIMQIIEAAYESSRLHQVVHL